MLNVAIAGAAAALVARKSKPLGVAVMGVSTALIYLRGYLVPGTPTLTQRYLPDRVLRWFGKDPEPAVASGFGGDAVADEENPAPTAAEPLSTENDPEEAVVDGSPDEDDDRTDDRPADEEMDMESYLLEYDLVETRPGSEDLHMTESFETAWFDEAESIDPDGLDAETVGDEVGLYGDSGELELVDRNGGVVLRANGAQRGVWPSRIALVADVAAGRVLDSQVPDWDAYDYREKGRILNSVRMFLERCPDGSGVRSTETRVESCCRPHTVFAVVCEDSDERLFEHAIK